MSANRIIWQHDRLYISPLSSDAAIEHAGDAVARREFLSAPVSGVRPRAAKENRFLFELSLGWNRYGYQFCGMLCDVRIDPLGDGSLLAVTEEVNTSIRVTNDATLAVFPMVVVTAAVFEVDGIPVWLRPLLWIAVATVVIWIADRAANRATQRIAASNKLGAAMRNLFNAMEVPPGKNPEAVLAAWEAAPDVDDGFA